jgi:hypothetical protein
MLDFGAAFPILLIACTAILVVVVLMMPHNQNNDVQGKHKPQEDSSEDQLDLDLGTKLMLGAMGAKKLDEEIEEQEREAERKRRELFSWQDSIREKDHLDDFD